MKILKGSTKFKTGIANPAQMADLLAEHQHLVGLAFVGRSNVGKSTLINALFGKKTARISNTPGKTREINVFEFCLSGESRPSSFLLFDLPGYGFAEVSKKMRRQWDILMEVFFRSMPRSVALVNLQDARHPHMEADREFNQFLGNFNFPSFLVFNKMDKLKRQRERASLAQKREQLLGEYPQMEEIFFVSAKDKSNLVVLEASLLRHLQGDRTSSYRERESFYSPPPARKNALC